METSLPQRYAYKDSPYSSHSLLLSMFPAAGQGRSVLDVGCWDGMISRQLAALGYQVTGIDVQAFPDMHSQTDFTFIEANLHNGLPAIGAKFDFILCADVLEHLLNPSLVLHQLHGLLKPGGHLLASLPNSGNIYFRLVVLSGRFPKQDKGLFDRTHLHFYTRSGWRRLFEDCGYKMVLERESGIPVGLALESNGRLARSLEWFAYQAAKLWKSLFAYQFVVQLKALHD